MRVFKCNKESLEISEAKDNDSVIVRVGDKWRIKGKKSRYWDAKYKTKKDAQAALRGYWASKNEDYENYNEDYDLTLEASVERERAKSFLEDKVGKGYFDKYLKVRNRLTDKNLKDFNTLITLDPEDVKVAIDRYYTGGSNQEGDGAKIVAKNGKWTVYHVTTFEKSQELGDGTGWCISGNYGNMNHDDSHYFYDYINRENLDGGYYFYIPNDGSDNKYCLLLNKNGVIKSLWNADDDQVGYDESLDFPEVRGIDLSTYDYEKADKLYERLHQAYWNDESDDWEMYLHDLEDMGEYVDDEYPSLEECIEDDKPNIFKSMLEWGFFDIDNEGEVQDIIFKLYETKTKEGRKPFFYALPSLDGSEFDADDVFSKLSGGKDIEFFFDFYKQFNFQDIFSKYFGLSSFISEIMENENFSSDILESLLENSYGDSDITNIFNDEHWVENEWEESDTDDKLKFIKELDNVSDVTPLFKKGGKLHIYDIIEKTGLDDIDEEYIKGLLKLDDISVISLEDCMSREEANKLIEEYNKLLKDGEYISDDLKYIMTQIKHLTK